MSFAPTFFNKSRENHQKRENLSQPVLMKQADNGGARMKTQGKNKQKIWYLCIQSVLKNLPQKLFRGLS